MRTFFVCFNHNDWSSDCFIVEAEDPQAAVKACRESATEYANERCRATIMGDIHIAEIERQPNGVIYTWWDGI